MSRLIPQTVRLLADAALIVTEPGVLHTVTQALRLFTGITSADGYENLTSHLGPDKKVQSSTCPSL